ncbi:MAG TPA: S41 family peptidase [Clostridiaceae bacterium]|nr:S41 family peptidase [Clostridiaceae bacterium]
MNQETEPNLTQQGKGRPQQHYPNNYYPPGYYGPPPQTPVTETKCFWKIVLAVLLTAVISITLTLGASYVFFSTRQILANASRTEQGVGIGLQTEETESSATTEVKAGEETGTEAPPSNTIDTSAGLVFERTPENTQALEKLSQIWDLLKDNFYVEYSDSELINMMSEGLVMNMGSRYTFYLSPEERELDREGMSGEYSGIGAVVQMNDDGTYVITRLIDDAPAIGAGLQAGDIFIAVDGREARDFKSVESLASAVRGEEGSKVEIEIYRPSLDRNITFEVERKQITTANLSHKMLDDNVGYIYVTEFTGHVADNFEQALKDLLDQGMTGLVIDLRDNGGGLADECIQMLDLLLDTETVSVIKGRIGGEPIQEDWTTEDGVLVPRDMSVSLVLNQYSASASELFAGALQDLGRAEVVGVQSFGKGVGTRTWELTDGSAVQITNFEYFLPAGENIEDKGITPDHEVELPEEVATKQISQLTGEEDTQLAKAIDLVTGN